MRHGIFTAGLLALLLAAAPGCAAEPQDRPTRAATGIAPPKRIPPAATATATAEPAAESVTTAAVPAGVRRAVVADAARRLKVAESAVVLTRAEQVTWADGSLGCPQPGRMYTQNLVAGYRMVAKTAQGELVYHTDGRGNVATCADSVRNTPRDR